MQSSVPTSDKNYPTVFSIEELSKEKVKMFFPLLGKIEN